MKHTLAQAAVISAMLWLAVSDFANPRLPERTLSSLEPAAGNPPFVSPDPILFYESPELFLDKAAAAIEGATTGPTLTEQLVRVRKGDTLMNLLVHAHIPRTEAHYAIEALKKSYNPRKLMPGTEVVLRFLSEGGDPAASNGEAVIETFDGLRVPIRYDRDVIVRRNEENGFVATTVEKELERDFVRVGTTIESSLFEAADRAEMPTAVVVELIRAYSFDIDFQREIRSGDSFEMMFERFLDEEGQIVHNGNVIYAELVLRGKPFRTYRHSPQKGVVDYFNMKGESVRKALMRTPIDGARISSHYGKRRHPILGYTRIHRGVDFAAPAGTPVLASGNGVVERANWHGGYGKYIRIRHNSSFKTVYAHLKHYARGVRKGKRVKQGQIIGYVGSTGRSTGPHLHYEVHEFSRQINPMRLKLPSGLKLKGKALAKFEERRAEVDTQLAVLPLQTQLASKE
jgi:murein DD-endopeptidase MepM/ murein hydrolase activator NlpD